MRKFTSQDARTMTPEQVIAFWRERQIENRAAGREHYTTLVDAVTDRVYATIDPE